MLKKLLFSLYQKTQSIKKILNVNELFKWPATAISIYWGKNKIKNKKSDSVPSKQKIVQRDNKLSTDYNYDRDKLEDIPSLFATFKLQPH